jgi:amidase
VPRKGWFGISRNMDAIAEQALADLRQLGAVLVDPVELDVPSELAGAEMEVLLYELKAQLASYLQARGPDTKVRNLADVIAFDKAHAADELALFGQEWFEQAEAKGSLGSEEYLAARTTCIKLAREQGIDKVMETHRLDAIFAATGGPPWLIDPVNGDSFGPSCTTLPAVAGYPHITIPAGQFRGLPMGISLFGRAYSEAKLLGYAFAYEQATQHRRPPQYLPTAPIS